MKPSKGGSTQRLWARPCFALSSCNLNAAAGRSNTHLIPGVVDWVSLGGMSMEILIGLIGLAALAMLIYYFVILLWGDRK